MKSPKAIICDIDGCIADHRHRLHYVDLQAYVDKTHVGKDKFDHNSIDWSWKKDYDSFYAAMGEDGVNEYINELITAMFWHNCGNSDDGTSILFVTGRPEKYRELTEKWLSQTSLRWNIGQGVRLFMRPDYVVNCCGFPIVGLQCQICYNRQRKPDHRPSHIVKQEIYEREIKGRYDILFCLDDNEECCEMYNELGLTVLRVL
jgi:hypothetical protein